jgi:dTMP kinase
MRRGALIVVEGLDRAGKSTQCERIERNVKTQLGHECVLYKFPDRSTAIGSTINNYLQNADTRLSDQAIHLLFSANRWERAQEIIDKLNAGVTVVLDRYVYSGIAFTMVKGLDKTWCKSPDVGLPGADLVLFLDVSESVAKARGGYGTERYEKIEIQRAVRKAFLEELKTDNWKIIDANQDLDAVETDILAAINSTYNNLPQQIPVFK